MKNVPTNLVSVSCWLLIKIPDISNLAAHNTLNAKMNEFKKEIPSVTN